MCWELSLVLCWADMCSVTSCASFWQYGMVQVIAVVSGFMKFCVRAGVILVFCVVFSSAA